MKRLFPGAALVIAALLTTACGFHLRGTSDFSTAYVKAVFLDDRAAVPDVARIIRRDLGASGISLANQADYSELVVVLEKHEQDRRIVAVNERGQAAEYELSEKIIYSFRDRKGIVVVGPETAVAERVTLHDVNRVVSTASEERLLRQEMSHALAQQILRRISTYRPDQAPAPAP